MNPYAQSGLSTLYRGDCMKALAATPDEQYAAVITDPPYSDRTHKGALSNSTAAPAGGRAVGAAFAATGIDALRDMFAECARVSQGWVISFLDYAHAFELEKAPPPGLRVLRIGVWVKTNPMPQLSKDRPAQGWEAIVYMHRDDRKPSWNGGGKHGNFVGKISQRTGHPTAKPLEIVEALVERFTDEGDTILDPFAGSGTTLRAAQNLGRHAVGYEIDERYCQLIALNIAQEALFT